MGRSLRSLVCKIVSCPYYETLCTVPVLLPEVTEIPNQTSKDLNHYKMHASTTLYIVFLLLCTLSFASPTLDSDSHDWEEDGHRKGCLSKADVERIQAIWLSFFVVFNESLAAKSVTDDFQVFSDSTNNFIVRPV